MVTATSQERRGRLIHVSDFINSASGRLVIQESDGTSGKMPELLFILVQMGMHGGYRTTP